VLAPSLNLPVPSHTRAIVLLAVAGFASQAMVRVADSILPQIASDLGVTIGAASTIVSAYAIMHGSMQLVIGPLGDRFGKYLTVAVACGLSSILVMLCGFAQSLSGLTLARLASGAAAAWIIPLGMAYIGDVVPYERRQHVIGRYLTGQISGQIFGQAAGGIIGDWLGWRSVFFLLAAVFALAAVALFRELAINPLTRFLPRADARSRGFVADYSAVLSNPWARIVLLAVFLEAALMFGAFAYVGADLHARFGLSFTLVGALVGTFGIGGLIYAVTVKSLVRHLGQRGLAAKRRDRAWRGVSHARHRAFLVADAVRHHSHRAWLLHAAQHAADQCNANVAAGPWNRCCAVCCGLLPRTNRGRRIGRADHRSPRGAAGVFCRGDSVANPWLVVCEPHQERLAHIPEKWIPVFRKGYAPMHEISSASDSIGTDAL